MYDDPRTIYLGSNPAPYKRLSENYKWKNQDFAELAANNPKLNYTYTDGWWDKIGDYFGFRTQQDKVRDEANAKASDYEAELMQTDREENYNSAEEQAQRMRDAGINPNLQQGAVSPGDASGIDNQAVQGMDMGEADAGKDAKAAFGNFIGTILNITTTGIGLLNDVEGLFNKRNQGNAMMYDFVKDFIINNPGKTEDELIQMIETDPKFTAIYGTGIQAHRASAMISSLYNSPQVALDALGIEDKTVSTKHSIAEKKAHPYYSDDLNLMINNYGPFVKAVVATKEAVAGKEKNYAEIERAISDGFKIYTKEILDKASAGDPLAVHTMQALTDIILGGNYKENAGAGVVEGIIEAYKKSTGWKIDSTRETGQLPNGTPSHYTPNAVVETRRTRNGNYQTRVTDRPEVPLPRGFRIRATDGAVTAVYYHGVDILGPVPETDLGRYMYYRGKKKYAEYVKKLDKTRGKD